MRFNLLCGILKVGPANGVERREVTNLFGLFYVTGAIRSLGTTAIAGYSLAARLDYIMGPAPVRRGYGNL